MSFKWLTLLNITAGRIESETTSVPRAVTLQRLAYNLMAHYFKLQKIPASRA